MNNDLKEKWEALAERHDQMHRSAKPEVVAPTTAEVCEGDSDEMKLFLRVLAIPRVYPSLEERGTWVVEYNGFKVCYSTTDAYRKSKAFAASLLDPAGLLGPAGLSLDNNPDALAINGFVRRSKLWREGYCHNARKVALKLLESRPLSATKVERVFRQMLENGELSFGYVPF